MQTLKAAGRVADKPSWVLDVTLREHAKNLKLLIVCYNGDHGVWVRPADGADQRAVEAAAAAAQSTGEEDKPAAARGYASAYRADSEAGAHATRVAARTLALSSVRTSRMDFEGVPRIDIEAQSRKPWSTWRKSLTP